MPVTPRALPSPLALALALVLALPLLAACSGDGDLRLYPQKGPVALSNPARAIPITLDHDSETSGVISFRLPKPLKTKCRGTWTSVAPQVRTRERGVSITLRDTGGRYNTSTKDLGGVNTGEIYAICKDGTRVEGTFVTGSGTQSGTGSAADSKGNTYKLLF